MTRSLPLLPAELRRALVTLTETPRHNWGIRGLPGDELALDYRVGV